jgi:hypothetical protein
MISARLPVRLRPATLDWPNGGCTNRKVHLCRVTGQSYFLVISAPYLATIGD